MQDYIKINGIVVQQPDTVTAVLATTSTDDSVRDMNLTMHNTPIGTILGYDLKWKRLTPKKMGEILEQVINKKSFTVHHLDVISGEWIDADFYASNFNAPALSFEDGVEMWNELSFNIRGVSAL